MIVNDHKVVSQQFPKSLFVIIDKTVCSIFGDYIEIESMLERVRDIASCGPLDMLSNTDVISYMQQLIESEIDTDKEVKDEIDKMVSCLETQIEVIYNDQSKINLPLARAFRNIIKHKRWKLISDIAQGICENTTSTSTKDIIDYYNQQKSFV